MTAQAGLFDADPAVKIPPLVDLPTAIRKLDTAQGCLSAYHKTTNRTPLHDQCVAHFESEVDRWAGIVDALKAS